MDIITGAIGIFALAIIIIVTHNLSNARIMLDVQATLQHNRYPLFVICEKDKAILLCNPSYLPEENAKKALRDMCDYLELTGINKASPEESWKIMGTFISSKWFDRKLFYIFALIRPSGVKTFYKLDNLLVSLTIESGYMPIPEDWDIKVALKRDQM
ncbi:hypothetical protein [Thermodesulforhabdus norvegica]|nr:hypothetical protein [Thermodesulforhabdus norvegica]